MKIRYRIIVAVYFNTDITECPINTFDNYPSEAVIEDCLNKWKEESPYFDVNYAYVRKEYILE